MSMYFDNYHKKLSEAEWLEDNNKCYARLLVTAIIKHYGSPTIASTTIKTISSDNIPHKEQD